MNCKSLKSLFRYIKTKAGQLGIFSRAEIAQAQFDTKEVEQVWKASQEVQKSLREVRNLVLDRWTLGSTHGIGHWNRVYQNGMKLS